MECSFPLIGDSHDGQIDVCRLVAMVIWSWTSNVVNRGQNVPVGSTPTDTIGPRSRSRLSPRYVLVVLKWRKNRSIFKPRRPRVGSFLSISYKVTHFYASQPRSTIVRRLVRRPKLQKVLRSEVTLPPSVNKTIDSRLDRGKHFESNCTCWQSQTAADWEKETISCRSSSTVCTHSNNVVTGDRVGTLWGRHTARSPAKVVCHSWSRHNLLTTQSQFT